MDLRAVWIEFEKGKSLTRLATKYNVTFKTLANKLRRDDKERYTGTMRAKTKNIALSMVNAEMLKEFEDGKSLGELSRKYGVYKRTLQRRLIAIYGHRYKDLVKVRPFSFGLKTGSGDSLFETQVRELLEKNSIDFDFHVRLKLDGHRYEPDFMIGDNTIIEVAGMVTRKYWLPTSEKLRIYIKHGYRVILVMERWKLRKVQHYLPQPSEQFIVVEYNELKANFSKFTSVLNDVSKSKSCYTMTI